MSPGLLLYAVAGDAAIALMIGAIARDALYWAGWARRAGHPDAELTVLPGWYAAALVVSVALFLAGALLR